MKKLQKLELEHAANNKWLDEHAITYTDADSLEKDARTKRQAEYVEVLTPLRIIEERAIKLQEQIEEARERLEKAKEGLPKLIAFLKEIMDFDTAFLPSKTRLLQELTGEINKRNQIIDAS